MEVVCCVILDQIDIEGKDCSGRVQNERFESCNKQSKVHYIDRRYIGKQSLNDNGREHF